MEAKIVRFEDAVIGRTYGLYNIEEKEITICEAVESSRISLLADFQITEHYATTVYSASRLEGYVLIEVEVPTVAQIEAALEMFKA